MALVLVIAALIFADSIQMWQIYVISLAFGIADAFMFPASISLPPRLLEDELLPAGNSLIQGTAGLSVIVGPALAGVIIAYVAAGEGSFVDQYGLATAFLLDGITFLAPVIAFLIIRDRFPPEAAPMGESLMHTMMEGLRYTWNDRPVRFLTFMFAGLSVVFRGPFSVGMPVFADQVLPQGAAGYGTIVAAAGVGALLGVVAAGSLRRTPDSWLGSLILLDFGFYGLVFVGMTFTTDLVTICSMLFGASILDGYINIVLITWLQQRIPRERLGRVISVIMFFNLGLTPLSMAVAGWLIRWDLLTLMFSAGLVLWSVAVLGLLIRPLRQMGFEPD
jgi:MFS family permease